MSFAIDDFLAKWLGSEGSERANKDSFFRDLCAILGVNSPEPETGNADLDSYVFERSARLTKEKGITVGKIDVFRAGCFIFEAKQAVNPGSKKAGPRRGSAPWSTMMSDAYGQALGYARTLEKPVPFLIVCDIGHCFDLYAAFDGDWAYRHFPDPQASRIFLKDLPAHLDTFRALFADPLGLNPATKAAKITLVVAGHLAELAKRLENAGNNSELVAKFLMRCLFTMFAEDVELLPKGMFTKALKDRWIEKPERFPAEIESLWQTMNDGGHMFTVGRILQFNGGLFAQPSALRLDREDLKLLHKAATRNWTDVEPSIFGTLLERALNPKERHNLGAHYTPRSYVERLVRATIEEPLRADWETVQTEVRKIVLGAGPELEKPTQTEEEYLAKGPTKKGRQAAIKEYEKLNKAREAKLDTAREILRAHHRKLTEIRVLDPACGTGNFLYVTLDLFKRLEGEMLVALRGVGVAQELLAADALRVTPAQFLGIEVKRWAKEIAELVLWIGYLQWHFRTYGKSMPVPEPVLRDYKNIERRDAVLDYDSEELLLGEGGKPVTRWDGETMKKSPVTGEDIPDESARVPAYWYVNPRAATWPKADFIVGNPPFVGNKRMRLSLGDGYVETLRQTYRAVPEATDYVMYWWHKAGELVRSSSVRRAGLITTNSITQSSNRQVIANQMDAKPPMCLSFAIPDHPWVDSANGAAVRIAMAVGTAEPVSGTMLSIASEAGSEGADGSRRISLEAAYGRINPDLSIGADLTRLSKLKANMGMACPGVQLSGQGFVVPLEYVKRFSEATQGALVRPYLTGRDLAQIPRTQFVIDAFGLSEEELVARYPDAYQWLSNRVKPERAQNPRAKYAREWWLHSEPRIKFRRALDLPRFIGTSRTARHRVFQMIDGRTLPETTVLVIALPDALFLGILSSRLHVVFADAAGGRLGVGNDSRYQHASTFIPFPFPACTTAQQQRIRDLGETMDVHRKQRQAMHAGLSITAMYNVLEKLRSTEALDEKDRVVHEQGLVSVLKQIHDDLDVAVFAAYGWSRDLTDQQILEKIVLLNAERAAEEKDGTVRWLRPELQNPAGSKKAEQGDLPNGEPGEEDEEGIREKAPPWPKKLGDRMTALRDLLLERSGGWTTARVVAAFDSAATEDVVDVLDGLASLGHVLRYEAEGEVRWQGVQAMA